MIKNKRASLLILIAILAMLCLVFAACGGSNDDSEASAEDVAVSEQNADADDVDADKAAAEEAAKAEEEAKKAAEEEAAKAEEEAKKAAEEEAAAKAKEAEEQAAKEKAEKEKNKSKNKKKDSSKKQSEKKEEKKKEEKKEKKKVWVEPVTETRTVTLDTGTRYCDGANSGGGCGASWHGSKDSTYNSWHKHWQDYVKRRTKEEAAEGKVYVCDHIHDDSRWVPDTTTEEVVVKEGYWKEVDD